MYVCIYLILTLLTHRIFVWLTFFPAITFRALFITILPSRGLWTRRCLCWLRLQCLFLWGQPAAIFLLPSIAEKRVFAVGTFSPLISHLYLCLAFTFKLKYVIGAFGSFLHHCGDWKGLFGPQKPRAFESGYT